MRYALAKVFDRQFIDSAEFTSEPIDATSFTNLAIECFTEGGLVGDLFAEVSNDGVIWMNLGAMSFAPDGVINENPNGAGQIAVFTKIRFRFSPHDFAPIGYLTGILKSNGVP